MRYRGKLRIDRHLARSLRFDYIEIAVLLCSLDPKVLIQRDSALPFLLRFNAMDRTLSYLMRLLFYLEFTSGAGYFEIADAHKLLLLVLIRGKYCFDCAALFTECADLRLAVTPVRLAAMDEAGALGQTRVARHFRGYHSRSVEHDLWLICLARRCFPIILLAVLL